MKTKLYTHKDVSRIIGITKRQVSLWSERGIITAHIESVGKWDKRKYDYTNLLEFSLSKQMFSMGIKFRIVKKLIGNLRDEGELREWAENFESTEQKPDVFLIYHFTQKPDPNLKDYKITPWELKGDIIIDIKLSKGTHIINLTKLKDEVDERL
jgi:DNA-binding transcriptional MerR regulator